MRERKYIPCEELFSEHKGVSIRSLLSSFCNGIRDWNVINEGSDLVILPSYPEVTSDFIYERFSDDNLEILNKILTEIGKDYIPTFDDLYFSEIEDSIKYRILNRIAERERVIISYGGRSFIEELKYRLGVR